MKFDMHCHTKEGSIDGKVGLEEYIQILRSRGFSGMLVTDHNSYNGYRFWKEEIKDKYYKDFFVLKGIEYDTINAGHMLVIMPQGVKPRILEVRGMPVTLLTRVVHAYGGVVGPAHPFGEKYMSFAHTKAFRRFKDDLMKRFDFVETFNACESPESNTAAKELAKEYFLPGLGGSDSHKSDCVGLAYTKFTDSITQESDVIALIKKKAPITSGGEYYKGTVKEKIGRANDILVYSFWLYNKMAGLMRVRKRRKRARYLTLSKDDSSYKTS